MKKSDLKMESLIEAAAKFYGDLSHPRIGNGGIIPLYEKIDRNSLEILLKDIFDEVKEDTDLNDDRCIVYKAIRNNKHGIIFFSFIDKYVYLHNFSELIDYFRNNKFTVIDHKMASIYVDANADFFSYESEVQIFNLMFSNYMIDSLSS
jgi:hypothetical protein